MIVQARSFLKAGWPASVSTSGLSVSIIREIVVVDDENKDATSCTGNVTIYLLTSIVHQELIRFSGSHNLLDASMQPLIRVDGELNYEDIFQDIRKYAIFCDDVGLQNEYIRTYFDNVHPLLPLLHKESFLRFYRFHGLRCLGKNVIYNEDGSSRTGRAVSLICAVLALGSLGYTGNRKGAGSESVSEAPYIREALGFYEKCLYLLAYSHDTLESIITNLLMAQ
jgi:hypothetical protein